MSNNRLKNLVHFICRECSTTPDRLGKVKLQKILFLSDLWKFKLKGETITGTAYVKKYFGPYNKGIDPLLLELQDEGKLTIIPRDSDDDYDTVKLIGKGQADISDFDGREIDIIKEKIDHVCDDHTATSISERTHGPVWQMADMNEEMPFEAQVVISLTRTTQEDIENAASLGA